MLARGSVPTRGPEGPSPRSGSPKRELKILNVIYMSDLLLEKLDRMEIMNAFMGSFTSTYRGGLEFDLKNWITFLQTRFDWTHPLIRKRWAKYIIQTLNKIFGLYDMDVAMEIRIIEIFKPLVFLEGLSNRYFYTSKKCRKIDLRALATGFAGPGQRPRVPTRACQREEPPKAGKLNF